MIKFGRSKSAERKSGRPSKDKKNSAWDKAAKYFVNGMDEKAILMLNKCLLAFPNDAKSHYLRGEAFSRLGENQKALTNFNKAIRLDPKNANAFDSRGKIYTAMGDFERAIKDFSKAIKIYPKFPGFLNSRGITYFKMGRLANAMKDFTRAIKLDPDSAGYCFSEAYLYSAMIMHKNGNQRRAKLFFNRAVKLDSLLILADGVWELAKDGFFPAVEYLYKTVKEARK